MSYSWLSEGAHHGNNTDGTKRDGIMTKAKDHILILIFIGSSADFNIASHKPLSSMEEK